MKIFERKIKIFIKKSWYYTSIVLSIYTSAFVIKFYIACMIYSNINRKFTLVGITVHEFNQNKRRKLFLRYPFVKKWGMNWEWLHKLASRVESFIRILENIIQFFFVKSIKRNVYINTKRKTCKICFEKYSFSNTYMNILYLNTYLLNHAIFFVKVKIDRVKM